MGDNDEERKNDEEEENFEVAKPVNILEETFGDNPLENPVLVGFILKGNNKRMTAKVCCYDKKYWNFLLEDVIELWYDKRKKKFREKRMSKIYFNGYDLIKNIVINPGPDFLQTNLN